MHRKLDGGPHANSLLEAINATPQQQIPGCGSTRRSALLVAANIVWTGWHLMRLLGRRSDGCFTASRRRRRRSRRSLPRLLPLPGIGIPRSAWRGKASTTTAVSISAPDATSAGRRRGLPAFITLHILVPGASGSRGKASTAIRDSISRATTMENGRGKRRCRASTARPSLVVADNRLCLLWRGVDDDSNVRIAALREGSLTEWDDPQVVACAIASGGTSPIGSTRAPCRSPSMMRCSRSGRASPTTARLLSVQRRTRWAERVEADLRKAVAGVHVTTSL